MTDEPERLPPLPFWRTRYFAFDVMLRRPYLDPIEIRRILDRPQIGHENQLRPEHG